MFYDGDARVELQRCVERRRALNERKRPSTLVGVKSCSQYLLRSTQRNVNATLARASYCEPGFSVFGLPVLATRPIDPTLNYVRNFVSRIAYMHAVRDRDVRDMTTDRVPSARVAPWRGTSTSTAVTAAVRFPLVPVVAHAFKRFDYRSL